MDELELNEQQKAKLDNIVAKMVENKESDSDIQFVVDDFKSKYGSPKSNALSTQGGKSGAVSSSQVPPSKESTSVLEDIESESQSWKKPLQTPTKPAETPVQQPLMMKPVVDVKKEKTQKASLARKLSRCRA